MEIPQIEVIFVLLISKRLESFEHIVGVFLEQQEYWVRHSVKIELSKEERKKLGKKMINTPRPEIDIVAYQPEEDELILIEVKSFLDSDGVKINDLSGKKSREKKRYKLLNDKKYQKLITDSLTRQFLKKRLIKESTKIKYGLAAGKVQPKSESKITDWLNHNGYKYFSPEKIKNTIRNLAHAGWLDDIVTMTAKLTNDDSLRID